MTTRDLFEETYTALSANKARSGLTMLGIIIGIASVIALVSIGTGAKNSVTASIESLGSNLLVITPGAQRGPGFQVSAGRGGARTLTKDDAAAIAAQADSVRSVATEISGRYQVTAKGTNTNTTVNGVSPSYADIRNVEIGQGSFISESQNDSGDKVAVLGPTALTDLFGEDALPEDAVGQTVRIKNIQFKIIGVTLAKGGSGFTNADDIVYVPTGSAARYLSGSDYLTTIDVQATDADTMAQVQQDITALLLERHKISDPAMADFSVLNQADILSTASSITGTFTILLGVVAGISLLVGGIGIMNMMLTTVTERTREIGLRKAIGAKRRDINIQFLAEAVALTFIGGVISVALGWLVSIGVNYSGLVSTSVSVSSVLLAFCVSAGIGIVFGYYPARRAGALNPIDALRYE